MAYHEIEGDPLRPLIEGIESAGDRVGLYSVGGIGLTEIIGDEEGERPTIQVAFEIGERAWLREIQDPEGAAFDEEFGGITEDLGIGRAAEVLSGLLGGDDAEDEDRP